MMCSIQDMPPVGKWSNATHLGTESAALLVEPEYQPPATAEALPARGGPVAAVALVKRASSPPSRVLDFRGYEWRVRGAPSDRGGVNLYSSENPWIDSSGALHLRIAERSAQWTMRRSQLDTQPRVRKLFLHCAGCCGP